MATLASGASVTFPIAVDQVLTFTASTATGRAVLSAQKGGDVVFDFKNEAFNNTPIFTPGSSGIVTITSTLNPITYAVSNSQFPAYALDSSGNVTGLVGPGGELAPISSILKQSAVPVILAPNGTVSADGTITLGTALPTIYANAWVRLPAGAVSGGSAGLYFATFSSTTVGSVKTNFVDAATAFTPYIPAGVVAAVGSGSAYTQTTAADITLANVTLYGGLIGVIGSFVATPVFVNNNSAGAKVLKVVFGGISTYSKSRTTTTFDAPYAKTINRGSAVSQVSPYGNAGAFASGATATPIYSSIDTTADQSIAFTGQIATATDYIVLECFSVEVMSA